MIHRSDSFRAHKDSVNNVYALQEKRKIEIHTFSEVTNLKGKELLNEIASFLGSPEDLPAAEAFASIQLN